VPDSKEQPKRKKLPAHLPRREFTTSPRTPPVLAAVHSSASARTLPRSWTKRAAAIMSLVHSARLNGHDPYASLKDVLERLPTMQARRMKELLPHHWQRKTFSEALG